MMMECRDACDEEVVEKRTDAQRMVAKRRADLQKGVPRRNEAQNHAHSQEMLARREAIREKVRRFRRSLRSRGFCSRMPRRRWTTTRALKCGWPASATSTEQIRSEREIGRIRVGSGGLR